jgi:mRNA interferase MazF
MSLLHRGDVVALPPPRDARGREQRGRRYAVVVQASELAGLSTVIVAPTSTQAAATRFRPGVTIRGRKTRLLVEQLRTVDKAHLGQALGHLPAHEMRNLDESIRLVLGLF